MKNSKSDVFRKVATSAVGVGVAGFAGASAHAAVSVYDNGGAGWTHSGSGVLIAFDMDGTVQLGNDTGMSDYFTFNTYSTTTTTTNGTTTTTTTTTYLEIWAQGVTGQAIVSGLNAGDLIDSNATFAGAHPDLIEGTGTWNPGDRGFIGLEFTVGGQDYYGWADLTADAVNDVTLHAYAVEKTAGQGILAGATKSIPEPSTLGLLALGAVGLAAQRRRTRR